MTLDFSRCQLAPFAHQCEDVEWLVQRPYAFISSEMRTGKSAIITIAAQFLFEMGIIDKVLIVAPAPVRDVWYDQELGQIKRHAFLDVPNKITEFHARLREWTLGPESSHPLHWMVTGYEFIRSKNRLTQLLPFCTAKTLLVLDESSYCKNSAAAQTKACMQLRKMCGRVTLLNGTPVFYSPLDLFSQGNLLHPSVLDCKYITHFKARYAIQQSVLGHGGKALTSPYGHAIQKITGWVHLDELQRRFAPITVRRLQAECLDLPPKLDPVTLTATLDDNEWRIYRDMREELVAWLTSGDVAVSATAAVKALRLSQITGGFLGGIEDANIEEQVDDEILDDILISGYAYDIEGVGLHENDQDTHHACVARNVLGPRSSVQPIGRSKLDVLIWFLNQHLDIDPNFKVVCWFRFRAELLRALDEVRATFPQMAIGALHGGNTKAERREAMRLLHPDSAPAGSVFVGGIEGTGSFGISLMAAHTSIDYSSGYSPGRYAQKADRIYGPGQGHPCAYFNIVAVGPRGQRTIDHDILVARMSGEHVASRTASAWVKALRNE